MLKKILALLLVGALLTVGFASCSKKKTGTSAADDPAYQNDDDIIATFARVESVDADGNAQKDENGRQIYEYFEFESLDDETVELNGFRSEVKGSASGSTPSYIPCHTKHTVVIPNELSGKKVTNIGASAFKNRSEITSIVIPDTVSFIGTFAFAGCSSLTAVVLPASLSTLGEAAFKECTVLTSVTFNAAAPLETIGKAAFMDCSSLTAINIPASVRTISEGAFFGCSAATSVTVAEGTVRIEDQAFQGLSALTSLTLPAGVTFIGGLNFYGSTALTAAGVTAPADSLAEAYLARVLAGDPPTEAMTKE